MAERKVTKIKWEKMEDGYAIPVKSWCENCEEGAVKQAANLARHPALFHHVALMPDGHDYFTDMLFALRYAKENRRRMMEAMCEDHFGKKMFVHRKGATSAKPGEIGIIPGSMGTASYIVRGARALPGGGAEAACP